ncbi:unnamed protein product [Spodoptera exigua]|nr:unnamed protein product [Spodoptera exigua]
MHLIIRLICYSVIIHYILTVKAEYKSHLNCYYTKVCQQYSSRDGISHLSPKYSQAGVRVRGSNIDKDKMTSGSGVNGFYRPRSALARAMYEKQHNDRYLQELDQNELGK